MMYILFAIFWKKLDYDYGPSGFSQNPNVSRAESEIETYVVLLLQLFDLWKCIKIKSVIVSVFGFSASCYSCLAVFALHL